jgi:hypothetical protein
VKPAVAAGDLKPSSMVLLAGRAFANSTEAYLLVETDLSEFWLTLGNKNVSAQPLGHLHYVRCAGADEVISGRVSGTFELREVLPASSPAPHRSISLSGVLWPRQVILEER